MCIAAAGASISVTNARNAAAIDETLTASVAFWSSEDRVLSQVYGVAAIDPAARDLVDRQRERSCARCSSARAELLGR